MELARMLGTEPQLLLLDEPFSSPGAPLRAELRGQLHDLQRRTGVTTVFVTHDQAEALTMADRLGVMFNGRLEQLGPPEEGVRAAPYPPGGALFRGRQPPVGRFRLAGRVEAAVRSERTRLELHPRGEAAGPGALVGTVTGSSYRGGSVLYTVAAGGTTFEVADLSGPRLPVGCTVRLTFPAEGLWA